MPITWTFHIGEFTFTITIKRKKRTKSNNRHSAK